MKHNRIAGTRRGDATAVGALLARHRQRLRRMVTLRMDRRLQGRTSRWLSTVVQKGHLTRLQLDELTHFSLEAESVLGTAVAQP